MYTQHMLSGILALPTVVVCDGYVSEWGGHGHIVLHAVQDHREVLG